MTPHPNQNVHEDPQLVNTLVVEGKRFVTRTGDDEPRIRDIDVAVWLGYARPRKVRDLIRRLLRAGILKETDGRPIVGRLPDGQSVTEYWLSEAGALVVAARSEGERASLLLNEIIRVFLAVRHQVQLLPALAALRAELQAATAERDRLLRDQARVELTPRADLRTNPQLLDHVARSMHAAAKITGRSFHAIHGMIRRGYEVLSYKRLPLDWAQLALRQLDDMIRGDHTRGLPPARRKVLATPQLPLRGMPFPSSN